MLVVTMVQRRRHSCQEFLRFLHDGGMSDDPASVAADDPVLDGLGERLRQRRRARAMTLADLASTTGISTSLLSRLESGLRRPTLDVLLALARVYRLTLDELVGAHATGDPRLHPRPTTRYGMTWLPLGRHPGGIQAHKVILPAGPGTPPKQRSHQGYEWLYVLDGRLRLMLGEHDLVLTPGEVAEFDTHTPHCFANAVDRPTELLMLTGTQGQRAHVRARPKRNT